jgi:hypothetical protein
MSYALSSVECCIKAMFDCRARHPATVSAARAQATT